MSSPRYPTLYQVNTRVWLTELARTMGRPATLDDIPDAELDRFSALGFDWIWLLSVWQTGLAGQRVSRANPEWRHEFEQTLPDLTDEDIAGSGFAITGYTVCAALGGDAALARLRERMRGRGLRLMLDFVPNHTALDHPWVDEHPEYYIRATEGDLAREPRNFVRVASSHGELVLAHGRDPYFPGWPDTLQLDYSNKATQDAMIGELAGIAARCDGVRCDMAMLVLHDVFERTWGRTAPMFWPNAIAHVREKQPGFVVMAEVYWDLEWTMQRQGFDYAYDKRLYDRLREGSARSVREHLHAGLDYQDRLARFLENHDEPRVAAILPRDMHEAAAVITFLSPGLRFFHQGQFEGRLRRISPHLVRAPDEPIDAGLREFYERLLAVLRDAVMRDGEWRLLDCVPAWDGNPTNDCFIACSWRGPDDHKHRIVVVNYASSQSQCYVHGVVTDASAGGVRLTDLMSTARYDRDAADIATRGLYLDLPAWGFHVFEVGRV